MPPRLHALDNLRALAMLVGVLFHAALAHSPLVQAFWPAADRSQAAGLDLWLWPLHLVRMPIFFVLAGYFAAWQLERRGMAGLMADRARRVLLPLVVGVPLLHWSMSALVQHAALNLQHPPPILLLVRRALEEGWPMPPPGTGHLWFLYYLLLFTVLLWVGRNLLPAALAQRLRALPLSAWVLGLPLLLAVPLHSVPAPHPAPESLLPQFWAIGFYGAFFLLGYLGQGWLYRMAALRLSLALLLAGVAASAVFLALLKPLTETASWPLALASAAAAVWLTLAFIGLAQRFLAHASAGMRYLADASYWVYLVHLPMLLALQLAWLDQDWPWQLKLPLAVFVTKLLALLSFELWVRRGWFGRALLRRKRFSATVAGCPEPVAGRPEDRAANAGSVRDAY